jgi:dienelactone hydrolase
MQSGSSSETPVCPDAQMPLGEHMTDFLIVKDIYNRPESPSPLLPEDATARCFSLGDLSGRPDLTGTDLHTHLFEANGLETVLERLCGLDGRGLVGIGYSAGGTALWRAVARGLVLRALICVSSTRLRFETAPSPIPTYTFWGERDENRPSDDWCQHVPTASKVYPDQEHGFYQHPYEPAALRLKADIESLLVAPELLKPVAQK